MVAVPHRYKVFGGVFAVVTIVWTVDLLTRQLGPRPAAATPSPAEATETVKLPPDPDDLHEVIESLRSESVGRAMLLFDHVARDLFTPTPRMQATLATAGTIPASAEDPDARKEAVEPTPFDAQHELQGVLMGRVPLAVVDGKLYPCGAEIDGYRLIALHGDHVVFARKGERAILRVALVGQSE
jgi:hypothetical protein